MQHSLAFSFVFFFPEKKKIQPIVVFNIHIPSFIAKDKEEQFNRNTQLQINVHLNEIITIKENKEENMRKRRYRF